MDGDAGGLEDLEGVGADVAGDDRLGPFLDDELGRLDTGTASGGEGRVLLGLEGHRLRIHEDEVRASPEDRAGLRVQVRAVGRNDDPHLQSSL